MSRPRILLLIGITAVATILSVVLLWGTDVPLGIRGEWEWIRIPFSGDSVWGWMLAAIGTGMYAGFVWWGGQRISRCGPLELGSWLVFLAAAGFAWLAVVQECVPAPYGPPKLAWVLYFPGSSGYFTASRDDAADVRAFLSGYEGKMAEGDYLHIGTHPPGLILFHRGMRELCRRNPGLAQFLIGTQPKMVAEAFVVIEQSSRFDPHPLLKFERAAIWLMALVTQAAVALTVLPLYCLIRRDFSRETSWMSVSFWPLLPALAVFLPKSDALFPLIAASFVFAWTHACRHGSAAVAVVAGLVAFAGMFLSLAFLPVALFAIVLTVWSEWTAEPPIASVQNRRRLIVTGLCVGMSFAFAVAAVWLCFGTNMINVWYWNYLNHHAFYDHFTRSYWKWLFVNPLEVLFAVGAPIGVLAVAALAKACTAPYRGQQCAGVIWSTAVVWGLLWISGKNSGEVARLWILFMPWLVWTGAFAMEDPAASDRRRLPAVAWLVVLLLQAVVCIATVTRVSGFDFNPLGAAA